MHNIFHVNKNNSHPFYNITSKYTILTGTSISHATQLAGTTKEDERI